MSLQRWQSVLIGVGLLVIAVLAFGIARTRDDATLPPSAANVLIDKGGAEGHRFGSKTASWSLDYDKIALSQDQSFAELTNIKDGTFFRKGKPYLKIKAKHITVNIVTSDFTANGRITVRTLDGKQRTFQTDEVRWQNFTQQLTLDKPVALTQGDATRLHFTKGTIDVKARTVDLRGLSVDYGG
jgi:lipopolysaccharide export system protein LptC